MCRAGSMRPPDSTVRAAAGRARCGSFCTGRSEPACPLVLPGAALFAVFMISQTAQRLSRGRVRGMRWHDAYLWAALAVIFGNWIIKNALMLALGRNIL